jgi:hypothetical protein
MKYIVFSVVVLLSVISSCEYAFALPIWQKHLDGQIWSVDTSKDGSHIAAGTDINETAGKIYYYDKNGSLLWFSQQDRAIGKVSVSEDGSLILASGYQTFGRAGVYTNPATYLFDQSGNLLWTYKNANLTSLSSENQFLTGEITPQKKILIAFDEGLLYLNSDGNLLWNYTVSGRTSGIKISSDDSTIALGVIGNQDNVWWLYVFDNLGNLLWKYDGTDGIVQGRAVSLSSGGERIMVGSMASGDYGNLYMFDKGSLLWKRNVDGGVLGIDMSDDGTFAIVESNYGTTVFDESGHNTDTKPAFYTVLSSDDSFIVGANPVLDYYDLVFFDTQLNQVLIERIDSDIGEISANGKQVVVGTRQHGELGRFEELYLFENNVSQNKVNYYDFREATSEIIDADIGPAVPIDSNPCCDFTIPILVSLAVIPVIYIILRRK